jgi:hypothetical protein
MCSVWSMILDMCSVCSMLHDMCSVWSMLLDMCSVWSMLHDMCSVWNMLHMCSVWSMLHDMCSVWSMLHDMCSVWSMLHDTLMARRISRWLLYFSKICGPLGEAIIVALEMLVNHSQFGAWKIFFCMTCIVCRLCIMLQPHIL